MTSTVFFDDPGLNATVALDVYRADDFTPKLPSGWSHFMDCPTELQLDGYFGAAYISVEFDSWNNYQEIYILIAHRGTDDKFDMKEDLEMFLLKKIPEQFEEAVLPFIDRVLKQLEQQFPAYDPNGKLVNELGAIQFAGHSLGAILSGLSAPVIGTMIDKGDFKEQYPNIHISYSYVFASTFESPGALPFINQLNSQEKINDRGMEIVNTTQTFLADYDAINTCFEHVGELCYVSIGYDYLTDETGKLPYYPTNTLYWLNYYTIKDQHSMRKMYNEITSNFYYPLPGAINWPVGTEQALHAYLSYNSEKYYPTNHYKYWDGYIRRLWQQYPELQDKYRSYKRFKLDYIENELYSENNIFEVSKNSIDTQTNNDNLQKEKKHLHLVIRLRAKNYQPTLFKQKVTSNNKNNDSPNLSRSFSYNK